MFLYLFFINNLFITSTLVIGGGAVIHALTGSLRLQPFRPSTEGDRGHSPSLLVQSMLFRTPGEVTSCATQVFLWRPVQCSSHSVFLSTAVLVASRSAANFPVPASHAHFRLHKSCPLQLTTALLIWHRLSSSSTTASARQLSADK